MTRFLFMMMLVMGTASFSNSQFAFSKGQDPLVEELRQTVYHFDQVAPDVYRSGLIPKKAAPLLKKLGLKTVINFDNDIERAQAEAEYLKLFGIYTVWIPWSGWGNPTTAEVDKFLSLMREKDLRPILIHCKRGSERAGTMMAIWRMSEMGWPLAKAYSEMKRYEYRRFTQGHLKRYVYQYARENGDENAQINNVLEHLKTNLFLGFYHLRKLNPFARLPTDQEIRSLSA